MKYQKLIIDSFVNSVYLYDDKIVLNCNYREGSTTITFDELSAANIYGSYAVPNLSSKVILEKKYQNKCQALLYMHFGLSYLEQTGQLSFTDEQKARLEDIRFEAGVMLLPLTLKGDVDFNRVKGQYEELYSSKGSTSEAPDGYDSN